MFDHIFVEIMVFCERTRTVIKSKYTDIDANFINGIALPVLVYRNQVIFGMFRTFYVLLELLKFLVSIIKATTVSWHVVFMTSYLQWKHARNALHIFAHTGNSCTNNTPTKLILALESRIALWQSRQNSHHCDRALRSLYQNLRHCRLKKW